MDLEKYVVARDYETIDIWPWGKRWFLPHSLAMGRVEPMNYSVHAETGEVLYDQVFKIAHLETLTDDRVHARLLRWFWIKAHLLIWRVFGK